MCSRLALVAVPLAAVFASELRRPAEYTFAMLRFEDQAAAIAAFAADPSGLPAALTSQLCGPPWVTSSSGGGGGAGGTSGAAGAADVVALLLCGGLGDWRRNPQYVLEEVAGQPLEDFKYVHFADESQLDGGDAGSWMRSLLPGLSRAGPWLDWMGGGRRWAGSAVLFAAGSRQPEEAGAAAADIWAWLWRPGPRLRRHAGPARESNSAWAAAEIHEDPPGGGPPPAAGPPPSGAALRLALRPL